MEYFHIHTCLLLLFCFPLTALATQNGTDREEKLWLLSFLEQSSPPLLMLLSLQWGLFNLIFNKLSKNGALNSND